MSTTRFPATIERQTLPNNFTMNENESDVETDGLLDEKTDRIDAAKFDATHREMYEKLKRQERAEREELERDILTQKERALQQEKVRLEALNGHSEKDSDSEEQELDLRVTNNHRMHNFTQDRLNLSQNDLQKDSRSVLSHHDLKLDSRLDSIARGILPPGFGHPAFYPHIRSPGPHPDLPSRVHRDRYSRSPSTLSDSPGAESQQQGHHWTFEEQFKQLYELTDDPKRKEFLDDLFSYMQKRGTPVNRIPIMAKQTLDLYELFRLVVSQGGLVEVINRKLWREITKGLNLPSSITSAAFTLRTQYMKYLYPYECEKLKLSSPNELQNAIDGNRREGRRSGYGFDMSPGPPTLVPPPAHHHPHLSLNGSLLNGKLHHPAPGSSADDESLPSPELRSRSLAADRYAERDSLAMEAASRAMEEATRKMEAASRASAMFDDVIHPRKRLALDEERYFGAAQHSMPSAHLKITSRNDGRTDIDTSLIVSMEVNGIMYQGVLFAQPPRRI